METRTNPNAEYGFFRIQRYDRVTQVAYQIDRTLDKDDTEIDNGF